MQLTKDMKGALLIKLMIIALVALLLLISGFELYRARRVLDSDEYKFKQLVKNGDYPDLDRSDDLAGPDKDGNGIRDDIDAYIEKTYLDPKQKAAVQQYARSIQQIILVDASNKEASDIASLKGGDAIYCIGVIFKKQPNRWDEADKIKSFTVNTAKRMDAYLEYNKSRNGTTWSLPDGDTCEYNY